MLSPLDIQAAVSALAAAANATAKDIASGDVSGEEDISGQLLGRLKTKFEDFQTQTASWRVLAEIRETRDGPNPVSVRFSGRQLHKQTEEPWVGADLLFVISIDMPDFQLSKGLLVQSKRLEVGASMKISDLRKLHSQCRSMLDLSAASFVFLYASSGLSVVSAAAVEGSEKRDLHSLVRYDMDWVFADLLDCWIGDPRLGTSTREGLAILRATTGARNALLLEIKHRSAEGAARPVQ